MKKKVSPLPGGHSRPPLERMQRLHDLQHEPAVTLDGKIIHLSANIEDQNDIEAVIANGAEGVGLFRTEFLFISRDSLPTEEDQYKAYQQVATALKPHPVCYTRR